MKVNFNIEAETYFVMQWNEVWVRWYFQSRSQKQLRHLELFCLIIQ